MPALEGTNSRYRSSKNGEHTKFSPPSKLTEDMIKAALIRSGKDEMSRGGRRSRLRVERNVVTTSSSNYVYGQISAIPERERY